MVQPDDRPHDDGPVSVTVKVQISSAFLSTIASLSLAFFRSSLAFTLSRPPPPPATVGAYCDTLKTRGRFTWLALVFFF